MSDEAASPDHDSGTRANVAVETPSRTGAGTMASQPPESEATIEGELADGGVTLRTVDSGYDLGEVNWPLLLILLVLSAVGLTALSVTVAWIINSVQGYHGIMSVVLIPLWVISGAMFPVSESWLGVVMRLNPMTYMVSGYRHALGQVVGSNHPSLLWCLVILAGFCVATWGLAVKACKK